MAAIALSRAGAAAPGAGIVAEKKFAEALPLWESLARETGDARWPHRDILLELARAYDELHHWSRGRDGLPGLSRRSRPIIPGGPRRRRAASLHAQARLAVCLQNSDQLLAAATQAWKAVQSLAPDGSPEQQMALESLGLIYAQGRSARRKRSMVADLFARCSTNSRKARCARWPLFPSAIRFSKIAITRARNRFCSRPAIGTPATWMQPATQRLVLGAYGMKNRDQAARLFEGIRHAPAADRSAARESRPGCPPRFSTGWPRTRARQDNGTQAETFYRRVTQHPDPGDLLAGALVAAGRSAKPSQGMAGGGGQLRKISPAQAGDAKDATAVLLALGRAQLGAQNFDAAKTLGQQALLQEPEGPNSAAARMLLGETALRDAQLRRSGADVRHAGRSFRRPENHAAGHGPRRRCLRRGRRHGLGDALAAKAKDKYPGFQPAPYL